MSLLPGCVSSLYLVPCLLPITGGDYTGGLLVSHGGPGASVVYWSAFPYPAPISLYTYSHPSRWVWCLMYVPGDCLPVPRLDLRLMLFVYKAMAMAAWRHEKPLIDK